MRVKTVLKRGYFNGQEYVEDNSEFVFEMTSTTPLIKEQEDEEFNTSVLIYGQPYQIKEDFEKMLLLRTQLKKEEKE